MIIQKQLLDQNKCILLLVTNFKNMILKRSYRKSSSKEAAPQKEPNTHLLYNLVNKFAMQINELVSLYMERWSFIVSDRKNWLSQWVIFP